MDAEQCDYSQRRNERLGGRNADLRPGMHVDAAVGFTRNGAADDVDDGECLVFRVVSLRATP